MFSDEIFEFLRKSAYLKFTPKKNADSELICSQLRWK